MSTEEEEVYEDVAGAGLKSSNIAMVEDPKVDEGLAIVALYDPPSCLRCSHLLSLDEDTAEDYEFQLKENLLVRMDCHYSYGNTLCPAQSMRITKFTDIDKAVETYLEVLKSDDPNRLAQYMKYVGKKDKRTGQLIMERIKEITNQPNAPEPETTNENPEPIQTQTLVETPANSEEQKT